MSDNSTALNALGLYEDGDELKGIELHHQRHMPVCVASFHIPHSLDEDGNVKQLYNLEKGKNILKSAQHSLVVTGIDASQSLVRALDVKLKKEKDIDAALPFQAEPNLPFPIDEAYLDRLIAESYEDGTLLTLFAVKQDQLVHHLEQWKHIGIEPEIVGSVPHALSVFAKRYCPSEAPQLIIHIGNALTTCAISKNGTLLAAQSFKKGMQDLIDAYQAETGNSEGKVLINLDDHSQYPKLQEAILQLQRECVRSCFGIAKYARTDVNDILLLGEGSLYPFLKQSIAQAIGKPLTEPTIPAELNLDPSKAQTFAVPIGLALTGLPSAPSQIDFRQRELAYPHPWKRLKVPLGIAALLSIGLAIAAFVFGKSYLVSQLDEARQQYVQLVASLKKEYNEPVPPQELTISDMDAKLDQYEAEIDSAPRLIALYPNIPRVSDVLAWLGSHPQVNMEGSNDAHIHIETFNYRLVKRPELNKPRDPYQAQIDIEFSASTARAARLFYDSLIAPNNFVDPKGEVKWTASPGKYRITFFLKDRTVYPNPS